MRTLGMSALMGLALAGFASSHPAEPEATRPAISFKEAKFLIEHNGTDEDTGFQGFLDGEPWKELEILNPAGLVILEVESAGKLRKLGLNQTISSSSFETR